MASVFPWVMVAFIVAGGAAALWLLTGSLLLAACGALFMASVVKPGTP